MPTQIDVRHKGLVAVEPPLDRDPAHLDATFRQKLTAALSALDAAKTPFRLVEGFRTRERQQWLYGSGRPRAKPFGRVGKVVTNADGVKRLSRHQGNGTPGSCRAADCYPVNRATGKIFIPNVTDPIWKAYAKAAEAEGLTAGLFWPTLRDAPHCELE